jgi:hypothetical protein
MFSYPEFRVIRTLHFALNFRSSLGPPNNEREQSEGIEEVRNLTFAPLLPIFREGSELRT